MAEFTKEELAWVRRVQKVLNSCPSRRIAFATIGDCSVSMFDVTHYNAICEQQEKSCSEFIPSADAIGALFPGYIDFPNQVESTAG